MPRVPTYQRQVTSITPPSTKMQATGDANAYGAGVAQQWGQLGHTMVTRADEMQAEDDRNLVIKAKSDLDTQLTSALYDEKTGIMNQKGINALDLTNKFNQDFDNLVKTTAQTLKTKRQQDVFNQYSMGQKDNYLRSVSAHQARERQSYTEDNASVAVTSAQNLAIVNYNDQSVFDNSMATINKTIDSVYGYKGKDVTDSMKAKALSGIRSEQVTSMLSQGQGVVARDFLIAHKSEIDPKIYDNLFAGAETKAIHQESKMVTNDVFSRYGVNDERGAMKYLKDTYGDNPGYDKFATALQARFVDERRFKNEEVKRNEENILTSVWKAGSLSEAQGVIDNAVAAGLIKPSQGLYLTNQSKSKFKTLEGKATPEEKHWASYEMNGGLQRHVLKLREYYTRIGEGEEIPLKEQTQYDYAASQVTAYKVFKSNGTFDPNAKEKEVLSLDEYNALKASGFSDVEIANEYLTDGVE